MTLRAITVYYKPGCPFAAKLRLRLTLARIPYTTVKFPKDEAASAKVRDANHGNELSPTVEVGHRYLSNPSLNDIRQALHDDRDAS